MFVCKWVVVQAQPSFILKNYYYYFWTNGSTVRKRGSLCKHNHLHRYSHELFVYLATRLKAVKMQDLAYSDIIDLSINTACVYLENYNITWLLIWESLQVQLLKLNNYWHLVLGYPVTRYKITTSKNGLLFNWIAVWHLSRYSKGYILIIIHRSNIMT